MADRGIYLEIENYNEYMRRLDQAPEKLLKVSKDAMKAGGKRVCKIIRSRAPARFKRLVTYKISTGQITKDNYILMGFFNKDRKKGLKEIPDWFKAYWKNYGTLKHRDPAHHFREPVKPGTTVAGKRRRNNEGQKPEHFFEQSIQGWDREYFETFMRHIKENEDKLL